jgi:predicted transcriptional regulator
MEPRSGVISNGAVLLDDADDLVEGARVTIWIDEPSEEPVTLDEEELAAVDRGLREVAAGQVLDAREFVEELRRRG